MAKYLDLRVDKVFKAVFAQRAHKSSLIDLLNDLLPELNIRDLTYIRGEKLSEAINLVFVELGRFRKGIDELANDREKWFYVLKHIAQMEERPAEFSDRKFKRLFKVTEYESLPEQAKIEYDKVMTTERDRRNQMAYAIEVATEEGERKGVAKGHAEGSKDATLKIAKNMKAAGATSAFIASTTGLSEEEISNL